MITKKKNIKNIAECPHCKEDLRKAGIGFAQPGEMLYKVWFDEMTKDLQYETDEFEEVNSDGEYFCKGCGRAIPYTYDEVANILK